MFRKNWVVNRVEVWETLWPQYLFIFQLSDVNCNVFLPPLFLLPILKLLIKAFLNFLSFQAGTSLSTMNQEQAVSCYFPRCTWRHVRDLCPGLGPQWTWKAAVMEEAVTDSRTRRDPYRSFAVWLTAIYSIARFLISLGPV